MISATTDAHIERVRAHKDPDDLPVPPDQQPPAPVEEPTPSPGREVPEPVPIENPQPDKPKRIVSN